MKHLVSERAAVAFNEIRTFTLSKKAGGGVKRS